MDIREDIQELYDDLEGKIAVYLPNFNNKILQKAFQFSYKHHYGEKSITGLSRINHHLKAANVLADLSADISSIAACLLLQILQQDHVSVKQIEKKFGKEILKLIQGVDAITAYNYEEGHTTLDLVFLKDFFKLAGKDIRIFLIKICDRIETLSRIDFLNDEAKVLKANETLHIYVPLIKILGIGKYIGNVEDLCYQHIDPKEFDRLTQLLSKQKDFLENKIVKITKEVNGILRKYSIEGQVEGRMKTIFSINRKLERKHIPLSGILDLIAIRLVVESKRDVYLVLGLLHSIYKSKEFRIKDYISAPKPNGYQSIHTTVSDGDDYNFEIQIQTQQMYRFNMYGLASHNSYKGFSSDHKGFPKWMKKLLKDQKKGFDGTQIIESLTPGALSDNIICVTPKGDEITLPKESTVLDFACKLHTKMGERVIGSYINGEYVENLSYSLNDGDNVLLVLGETVVDYPVKYFTYMKTQAARKHLKSIFKNKSESTRTSLGKVLVDEKMGLFGYKPFESLPKVMRTTIQKSLGVSDSNELYLEVGNGNIDIDRLLNNIYNLSNDDTKYKTKVSVRVNFKKKDYKNIQYLFDVFHSLDIHLIKVNYVGIKLFADLHVKDLPTLHELIAEISRLPNVFDVKRRFIGRVRIFLAIFGIVSLFIVISPWILYLVDRQYQLGEFAYKALYYISATAFIGSLYFFKYIARVTLPGLLSRNIFWYGMFTLNTIILFTVILESIYVFKITNSIFIMSITLLLYGLTTFEYLDSKGKLKDN